MTPLSGTTSGAAPWQELVVQGLQVSLAVAIVAGAVSVVYALRPRLSSAILGAAIVSGSATIVQVQATPAPAYYFNPHWSSDGAKIVFESTRDDRSAIYTIGADGTNLRTLTASQTTDGQPRWSRDGKTIVFYSERGGRLQLYLMHADGSDQRALTDGNDLDYLPDLSPNADSVVFQSRKERPGIAHDIYTIRVDGTGRTRLTDGTHGYTSPKWSPDGKTILFERAVVTKAYYRDLSREELGHMKRSTEICVMDRDGTNLRNLTNNDAEDSTPQWSADGTTVYFMSTRDGSSNVYAMDANGANSRKIADGTTVTSPFVSPDARSIAYTKEVGGRWGLYVYDIAAGKERLLIGG